MLALFIFYPLSTNLVMGAVCFKSDISIFYLNGMFNERDAAYLSLLALQNRLGDSTTNDEKINYALSYNKSENALFQLLEVARQEGFDNWSRFFQFLNGISIAPEWFQDKMNELATEINAVNYVIDENLQSHVQKYRSELLEGKKALVVAHSQGNFYANEAYNNLESEISDSFGIVSVATPANYVAGGGPYTTLVSDVVIEAVRIYKDWWGTLLPNVTNSSIYEWTSHAFVKSYLNGDVSGPKIVEDIWNSIDSLEDPENIAEQGIITVTLEWGAEPDVDLHVYEPNGFHVYYGSMYGTSGYLDVDDITSYGPEHYYVSCETLQTGTYQIGVNYYWGDGIETARIQVNAGQIVRNYSISLSTVVGSDGNNSPIPVATIDVTVDENNVYQFSVSGS